ncbi:diaminopimelate epimerase [Sphingomonas sp. AX6]|uniref:diaminopimelate epimerase n=1 Tax=Sphingomonas sp. AX6 TaxID=2653171 RepID=UPI00135BB77F|nr:diaminopimelate epimerase [Sphingomonas sp. AX6]
MRIEFIKCHGSGNDFPLVDGRGWAWADARWAALARAMADREGPVGGDGLLALVEGDEGHAFGMRMFNSDGSEAETCLNGLRCTARLGFELLGLDRARVNLKTSSADVARADPVAPGVETILTRVGPVSTATRDVGLRIAAAEVVDAPIAELPSARSFTAVAMPNPHLVTFVERVDEGELVALGEWCEAAPMVLPARGNVSFVAQEDAETIFVRTFERGVGLTDSCGSAMAASTLSAVLTGRVAEARWVTVRNRGGLVRAMVERGDGGPVVSIAGNATFEADRVVECDPATGTLGAVETVRERRDEIAAWAGVLAAR